MNFEHWATGTFASPSLAQAVSRYASPREKGSMHKALHMADTLLPQETVEQIAFGRFTGFGQALLVLTGSRLIVLANSFRSDRIMSWEREQLTEVTFSRLPLLGSTLTLEGGRYRFSQMSSEAAARLQPLLQGQTSGTPHLPLQQAA